MRLQAHLDANADGNYLFAPGDARLLGATSFAAVERTTDLFWNLYGLSQWGFGGAQLTINPSSGQAFNAEYNASAGSIDFYAKKDPTTGALVSSAASGEGASHEVGHALLHALRPAYVDDVSVDAGGFRESFADITAFLSSMKDERTLARVAEQTGGDLTRSNVASRIGEQLGQALNHDSGRDVTGGPYLRDARNDFRWSDPATLPAQSEDPHQLTRDEHSYSQVWTGAFYDVFTGLVRDGMQQGQTPAEALRRSTDEGMQMCARLMKVAPVGPFTYRDMGEAFVRSDRELNGGAHSDLLTRVLTERRILPQTA